MESALTEAPPETPLQDPPESAAPTPPADVQPEPVKGNRTDLFVKRPRRTTWATVPAIELPDGTLTVPKKYLMAAIKPGPMAWVSNQCYVRRPDPEDDSKEIVDWDGTKRGFYMVAISLCQDDGKPMFPGTLEDPSQWIVGAMRVMDLENEEYNALFKAANEVSGFAKGAQAAAVKGSRKTPSTG